MSAQIIDFNRRRFNLREPDDSMDPGPVLSAIHGGRTVNLVRALSDIADRKSFFSVHYEDIASAICDRGDGDMLYALLKLGFPLKGEFMEWICRSGHVTLLQVAEECAIKTRWLDKSASEKPSSTAGGFRLGLE